MTRRVTPWFYVAAAAAAVFGAAFVTAGPLDPPAGSVVPTFKTLDQVEPRTPISASTTPGDADALFIIKKPGSYYLTGNVTGALAKDGISIEASNVTLDLNGFALIGVANSMNGVSVGPGQSQVVVRNGTVRNWGGTGVSMWNAADSMVSGVVSKSNSVSGINIGAGGTVHGCIASQNGNVGIYCTHRCTISDCESRQNSNGGVQVLNNNTVHHINASDNLGPGIQTSGDCMVSDCEVANNQGMGINAAGASTVMRNHVYVNWLDGVVVSARCRVTENTIDSNGSNGVGSGVYISAAGQSSVVADNLICGNDFGVKIDGTNCFVVRNVIRGNSTNLSAAAGNVVAPFTTSATIMSLTNPSTNFSN